MIDWLIVTLAFCAVVYIGAAINTMVNNEVKREIERRKNFKG